MKLPITNCPDGAGSLNNDANKDTLTTLGNTTVGKYVAPDLCIGDNNPTVGDDAYQESVAAENLAATGAPLNVFKLLGIHEQGKLIDLIGDGHALNGSAKIFDSLSANWISPETGTAVLTTPSWVGYDFGVVKTSFGQPANSPGVPNAQHITSIRIQQPTAGARALQVRVDRANGGFKITPEKVQFTGSGNGTIQGFTPGYDAAPGLLMITAVSSTQFSVFFINETTELLGLATVNQRFNSKIGSFTIIGGSVPYAVGDMFSAPVDLDWLRVDVVNLVDTDTPVLVRIKQSSPSRYWRIVPIVFSGVMTNTNWEISKLELFDYQATTLDDVQDSLFLENRDRDYANQSTMIKVAYQPFDAISDLSKFGFQVADMYTFTTTFATMVKALGRPIVVGDVLELPSETQYDHNLNPVRKFLEVTDTSWAADGFTTTWRPVIFKFQASQLIPGQEHRDLLGTVDTQKYVVDDGSFFDGIQQLQTGSLTATEDVNEEARAAAPEKGTNITEQASGTNRFNAPGSYDGVGLYVEDGLPADGQAYTEGFKLPDVAGQLDGAYFRLNYDPALNIASRLYKFSTLKNKWIYVETDRRAERSSHRPSQRLVMQQPEVMSLTSKKVQ